MYIVIGFNLYCQILESNLSCQYSVLSSILSHYYEPGKLIIMHSLTLIYCILFPQVVSTLQASYSRGQYRAGHARIAGAASKTVYKLYQ